MCFGFVFVENFEPVLDRLTILSLNRGKVALRALDFFAHAKMLQVDPIFYLVANSPLALEQLRLVGSGR